jgi:N-methylhydantoinase B
MMSPAAVDPITFEVLRNAFSAVCNEMALVVAKTAYSTPINEGRDFAGTVYDAHGKLVAQGDTDLPAFVGLTMLTVPEVIRAIGRETMKPEDIYMINDPYVASTHCNDIHLIKPIFHEGVLVAFTSSTAHWSDVGGVAPGSLNCRARSHFEEGVRIPALRIHREGELNKDVLAILLSNMRESWERVGDLNAQVAAVKAGEARIRALIAKHSADTVLATMEEVQNHSERLARASWKTLPDGVYESSDRIDMDIHTGEPVSIRLKLTIEDDHAIFDLTESDGPAESGINCTIAATTSAVVLGLASILPPMPMNSGIMRTIEIQARRGSICWAQPPVAISGLAATSMECTIGCVVMALSEALPTQSSPDSTSDLSSSPVSSTTSGASAAWAQCRRTTVPTSPVRPTPRARRISLPNCRSAATRFSGAPTNVFRIPVVPVRPVAARG